MMMMMMMINEACSTINDENVEDKDDGQEEEIT